jgi:UDP-N-acetylglucosamine 2-epimerase (non-hydrolysing)
MKKNVLVVFGTRPEAIKFAPLVEKLMSSEKLYPVAGFTGQHDILLKELLLPELWPTIYSWCVAVEGINLNSLSANLANMIRVVDEKITTYELVAVLVHGDTLSCLAGALAGYFKRIPVIHVEAGLRTRNLYQMFPECGIRQIVSRIAMFHFAPSLTEFINLKSELVPKNLFDYRKPKIQIVGNTVVDTLLRTDTFVKQYGMIDDYREKLINYGYRVAGCFIHGLVTMHRREANHNKMADVFGAINDVMRSYPEIDFVIISHPNNKQGNLARELKVEFSERVILLEPVRHHELVCLYNLINFVVSDSGGLPEETSVMGLPIIIARDNAERIGVIDCERAVIGGMSRDGLFNTIVRVIEHESDAGWAKNPVYPYGKGDASERIVNALESWL